MHNNKNFKHRYLPALIASLSTAVLVATAAAVVRWSPLSRWTWRPRSWASRTMEEVMARQR